MTRNSFPPSCPTEVVDFFLSFDFSPDAAYDSNDLTLDAELVRVYAPPPLSKTFSAREKESLFSFLPPVPLSASHARQVVLPRDGRTTPLLRHSDFLANFPLCGGCALDNQVKMVDFFYLSFLQVGFVSVA